MVLIGDGTRDFRLQRFSGDPRKRFATVQHSKSDANITREMGSEEIQICGSSVTERGIRGINHNGRTFSGTRGGYEIVPGAITKNVTLKNGIEGCRLAKGHV